MLQFITDNLGTAVVGLIVLAIVAACLYRLIADKKQGKSSCGAGCAGCPNAALCHSDNRQGK